MEGKIYSPVGNLAVRAKIVGEARIFTKDIILLMYCNGRPTERPVDGVLNRLTHTNYSSNDLTSVDTGQML